MSIKYENTYPCVLGQADLFLFLNHAKCRCIEFTKTLCIYVTRELLGPDSPNNCFKVKIQIKNRLLNICMYCLSFKNENQENIFSFITN